MTTVLIILMVIMTIVIVFALMRIRTMSKLLNSYFSQTSSTLGTMRGEVTKISSAAEKTKSEVEALKTWRQSLVYVDKETGNRIPIEDMFVKQDETAKEADDSQDPSDDQADNQKASKEDELAERREKYAKYRKEGMDVKSAGTAVGVSFTTAKRYEKWYKSNRA